jgi:hypothetical protein
MRILPIKIIFWTGLIINCIALPSYSAGFSLDYTIGFNGHFQLNNWTPLSVILDNRGAAIRGNLEVIVTTGSEYRGDVYRTTYSTEVELPQNSKKRYSFTILIKSFAHELIIRLRHNNDTLFSKSINLRPHFIEKNLAIVADNFVAPDILSMLPDHLYPANVRPKFLPETWFGYESVKLLILRADTIRRLRDSQFHSLIRWLKQGGYLVFGGGLNYGSLGDKKLQDILPIRVSGYQQMAELKSLEQFCGRELTGVEPFLVLNAGIEDADILAEENGVPIVTRKNNGFGQIVFLSFDFNAPPFSRWDGRRMFWNKIMSLQPNIDRPMIEVDDQQVVNSMLAGIPLKFPDLKTVAIFVCVYLLFLWFFLKKIKRPGKGRWRYSLCLVLVTGFFTFIVYRGFDYAKSKQKFNYNTFCQIEVTDPDTPAAAKYFIGLYSLTKIAYGLNFGAYTYPVTHIISEMSSTKIPDPYIVRQEDSGQYINGSVQRWSHNFYKMNLHFTAPLAGHARSEKSFMTLMVENKLPHNLVDCLIYYKKRFAFIEDIPAHSHQTIKINLAKLKEKEIFSESEVKTIIRRFEGNGSASYLRKTQRHLTSDLLLELHNKYKSRSDSMILVAWTQGGLVQPEFNPSNPPGSDITPPGSGITMINWELPVEIIL